MITLWLVAFNDITEVGIEADKFEEMAQQAVAHSAIS